MPRYDYKCPTCGWAGERITSILARDDQACGRTIAIMTAADVIDERGVVDPSKACAMACGAKLQRVEISAVSPHQRAFVTGAVLNNGQVVPGRFGASAPRKRKS